MQLIYNYQNKYFTKKHVIFFVFNNLSQLDVTYKHFFNESKDLLKQFILQEICILWQYYQHARRNTKAACPKIRPGAI